MWINFLSPQVGKEAKSALKSGDLVYQETCLFSGLALSQNFKNRLKDPTEPAKDHRIIREVQFKDYKMSLVNESRIMFTVECYLEIRMQFSHLQRVTIVLTQLGHDGKQGVRPWLFFTVNIRFSFFSWLACMHIFSNLWKKIIRVRTFHVTTNNTISL